MDSGRGIRIACTTVLLGFGLLVAKKCWTRIRRKPNGRWKQVGNVVKLNIYPIKSCQGISVNEGVVTSIGMEEKPTPENVTLCDRRMVIYQERSLEMVSARTYKQLLQVKIKSESKNSVIISYEDQDIELELPTGEADRVINLWSESVPVVDCGDDIANWLQKIVFDKPGIRLGLWPDPKVRRNVMTKLKNHLPFYPFISNDFTGAYSDLSSFLILNESSIEDLNKKIAEGSEPNAENDDSPRFVTTSTNFRGNIIINGPSAYEEDHWNWIKIGDNVIFRSFKPCTRCSLTTIDPETSEKDKRNEPLRTLKTYRLLEGEKQKLDPSPVMGLYVGLYSDPGVIKVGDPIFVCD